MKKLLVVDDELDLLQLIVVVLASTFEVVCASSSDEALEVARRERPFAILLDARMPGLDGFGTLRRLQQDPLTRTTPVILMTALAARDSTSIPDGFAGLISKPFDATTLSERILNILSPGNS